MFRRILVTTTLAACVGAAAGQPVEIARFEAPHNLAIVLPVLLDGNEVLLRLAATGSADPHFAVLAADGRPRTEFRMEIPGAAEAWPNAITPLADGSGYAIAGVAMLDGKRKTVLAFVDKSGKTRTYRQIRFSASELLTAPDGTVWAFGWFHDEATLRRYSPTGDLLGSYIPRSMFPAGQAAPSDDVPGRGTSALAVAGRTLYIYSAAYHQLCSGDLEQLRFGCRELPPPARVRPGISGELNQALFALIGLKSGALYATLSNGVFELDPKEWAWKPLSKEAAAGADVRFAVAGRGDSLLYRINPSLSSEWALAEARVSPRFLMPSLQ